MARYRDALGAPLPPGLPEALLEPVRDRGSATWSMRFARSHGPFTAAQLAARYGLGVAVVPSAAAAARPRPGASSKASSGPAAPSASGCDADVLRSLRSRSLAKLRHEIEAVDADALGRFMVAWHGIGSRRRGLEALLDAVEQLQGAAMPASVLERDILPARVADYAPGDARHADGGRRGGVGRASSRSASATGASRSTSPITSRASGRP